MKFKITNLNYTKNDTAIKEFLSIAKNRESFCSKLLKGVQNIKNIKLDDQYTMDLSNYTINGFDEQYCVLTNENGSYLIRQDNIEIIMEAQDYLDSCGISKLIKSGDKTIMISEFGYKYITTKHESDKDDMEKAIMLLLLKREGYNYQDIKHLAESYKDVTPKPEKKVTTVKKSTTKKPSTKKSTATTETV